MGSSGGGGKRSHSQQNERHWVFERQRKETWTNVQRVRPKREQSPHECYLRRKLAKTKTGSDYRRDTKGRKWNRGCEEQDCDWIVRIWETNKTLGRIAWVSRNKWKTSRDTVENNE